MRRTSTTQSPAHPKPVQSANATESTLDPVLRSALVSLDVQLEHELIRYRRQRALGRANYTPRPVAQRQVFQALDLMDLHATPATVLPPTSSSEFHPTATVPPLAAIDNSNAAEPAYSSLELKELAKQYASQVAAESDLAASVNGSPDDYLESSEELLRTLSQEQAQVEAEQGFMQSLLTPLGVGAMLLLLMTSALFGFVIMNPGSVMQLFANRNAPAATNSAPATSPTEAPQPDLSKQEFPDLNLGNLGSVPANQDSSGVAAGKPATKPVKVPATPKTSDTTQRPQATVPMAPSVNLPESVSGDVPSPRRLAPNNDPPSPASSYSPPVRSYTPPASSYTPSPARRSNPPAYRPAPTPSVSAPPARKSAPTPIKPYEPPTVTAPAIPRFSPSPSSAPPPLAPIPSPSASVTPASSGSGYKVVTPYTSDRALEDYRGKVPDAYVKTYSDGAKVQFGAYGDEAAAKAQAESLRKQGIPADVYKP